MAKRQKQKLKPHQYERRIRNSTERFFKQDQVMSACRCDLLRRALVPVS